MNTPGGMISAILRRRVEPHLIENDSIEFVSRHWELIVTRISSSSKAERVLQTGHFPRYLRAVDKLSHRIG
jgi:hypothetical protein